MVEVREVWIRAKLKMTYILKQRDHHLRHSVKTNIGLISKYYSIPKTITSIPTCPAKTSTRIPYFCKKIIWVPYFFPSRERETPATSTKESLLPNTLNTHPSKPKTDAPRTPYLPSKIFSSIIFHQFKFSFLSYHFHYLHHGIMVMLTQEMLSDFCANTNVLNSGLSYLGGASFKSYNKL